MRTPQHLLVGTLGVGLAASGLVLAPTPAQANPAGTGLVISEVYGAGGNTGAVYNADFVELYNPTGAAIDLAGTFIHYRSAAGGSGGTPVALSGSVPAHGNFLIRMGATGANGAALPTPDQAPGSFAMAASGGQVFLLSQGTAITTSGDMAGVPGVVDMVGASGSTSYEHAAATVAGSSASSLNRTATGADTDSNAADFALAAPSPTNVGGSTPPPSVVDATIAQIQGTGSATPLGGQVVHTTGVVTAVYADPYDNQPGMASYGGFDGFYLQTGGTGSSSGDPTPGASDGVFVYTGNDLPAVSVGDSLEVTGTAKEFSGLTEVDVTSGSVAPLSPALAPVTPLETAYPTTDAGREADEAMLVAPTDTFTVTDSYSTNQYGEIGLATGDHPLVQPTEVARPGSPEAQAVAADNAARGVVLDDGASIDYLKADSAQQDYPLPWLAPDNPVRVGAAATLHAPVVLDFRNGAWKLQPTHPVTDRGADVATFEDTRADNAAPQDVGGDLHIATFNVLNFFDTTGEQFVANGGSCTYYDDRDGNHISDRTCTPDGPRGAATDASFQRQEAKIVTAINGLGADIVSLEELENSIKLLTETDRDEAIAALVSALNADAGAGTWAYVASPAAASEAANVAEQDVIRTGFIYKPATVEPVGPSEILFGTSEFADAREPLAQAFKPAGAPDVTAFAVVANHFKSKGCTGSSGDNIDTGDGQGCYNGDRTRQATRLVQFADDFAAARGVEAVFLAGDFNSYTEEDPMHALYGAGFDAISSDDSSDDSYSFDGLSGSLDHVLGNAAAVAMVTGADVWEINADESVAFQYSRFNYNVTQLYAPDQFAASDHNPEVVGIDVPTPTFDVVTASAITGQPKLGKTLTGVPATFTPDPESVTYQWFADGVAIDGATGTTLKLHKELLGTSITFATTATSAGYADRVSTSEPTAPVKKGSAK
ncbi:MAG TPA: ExeM/NucH family extracellular endonuclease [Nocardioides sp.]|nr:ExeM/NucH family extracellular endonuclease [Nocardioides sp.]